MHIRTIKDSQGRSENSLRCLKIKKFIWEGKIKNQHKELRFLKTAAALVDVMYWKIFIYI